MLSAMLDIPAQTLPDCQNDGRQGNFSSAWGGKSHLATSQCCKGDRGGGPFVPHLNGALSTAT